MCGIAGIVGDRNRDLITRMTQLLAHRGPDALGVWEDSRNAVLLGHRRLSILDLDGGGQPMSTPDGSVVIVFNGEIYNFRELRQQLEQAGRVFQSNHSDTEVLIHGYSEWGHDLPNRLNGMWAFAVYDRVRGELFLSRDRMGKKPLYYGLADRQFIFASELTAVVSHPSVLPTVSPRSISKYFAYGYIPSPNTLYSDVYRLPAGTSLYLDVHTLQYRKETYWRFSLEPFESIPPNAEERWSEELRHLLRAATERRMISDVPLGFFLSGGMDSSAIVAFATQIGAKSIQTFSIGFEDPSFDESSHAEMVARRFGTDHRTRRLTASEVGQPVKFLPGLLDEPMGDSSLVPTYLLSQETRKHVTVALSGDGGDELFAGYDPFLALAPAEFYSRWVPAPVHAGIRAMAGWLPASYENMSLGFRLNRALTGLTYSSRLWNPIWLAPLPPDDFADALRTSYPIEDTYSEAIAEWEGCSPSLGIADRTLQFYTRLYLQDDILVKVDRASMLNSLEVRSPFLDRDVVDFARKIPIQFKLKRGRTKMLLRRALQDVIPREIINRPKKGFGLPIGRWFADGTLKVKPDALEDFVSPAYVERVLREHRSRRQDHRLFLWNYYLLAGYLQAHGLGTHDNDVESKRAREAYRYRSASLAS